MKIKNHNFVALDLGSGKIAAAAVLIDEKNTRVVSQSLQYAEGIKSGIVTDVRRAEHSVINSIYNLERLSGRNIQSVAVSLGGGGTKSYYIYQTIKLGGGKVLRQDIKKLISKMLAEFSRKDEEVIHYFPIEYIVDKKSSLQNPEGIYGHELGCRMHIVTVERSVIMNLASCLAKCQVEMQSVTLAIYAAGLACLTEDELDLGSVVIDMGAKTTAFGIFLAGKLLYTGHIPLGGDHITSDIAKIFSLNLKTAERLKVIYGSAMVHHFDREQLINLDEMVEGQESYHIGDNVIKLSELTQVINARVMEIFELIKAEYDRIGVDHMIARRIVLTGGSAALRNLQELVARIFNKQVRIGRPSLPQGLVEDYNPGTYAVLVGMIKANIAQYGAAWSGSQSSRGIFSKLVAWLKDNI